MKGLFEYWLKIKEQTLDNSQAKPTIKSVERLVDNQVILIKDSDKSNNEAIEYTTNNDIPQKSDVTELEYNVQNDTIDDILVLGTIDENITIEVNDESLLLLNNMPIYSDNDNLIIEQVSEPFYHEHHSNDERGFDTQESNLHESDSIPRVSNLIANGDQSTENKENAPSVVSQSTNNDTSKVFTQVFTLPNKYLPKKTRMKVEASGKPKLPSPGTSDEWLQAKLDKEDKEKLKETKLAKRKQLQEQKKNLAEEKKKLAAKMKDIQQQIKKETF